YARYGNLLNWNTCPDILPQASAHITVKFTDSVGVPAGSEREDCHAERIGRVARRLAQAEEILETDTKVLVISREMPQHHVSRKSIIPGRDGRVSREHI